MDGEESRGQKDTMRGRAAVSTRKLWLLMDADRRLVAGSILCSIFLGLTAFGVLAPGSGLHAADPVETLFQALITAIITGVTLVVTLNQLVLSQELGPVGDQRERMEGAISFREDASDILETETISAEPAEFFRELLETLQDRAQALADQYPDDEAVQDIASNVAENASKVRQRLSGTEFGTFQVISATLNFNYSRKLAECRQLAVQHSDSEQKGFNELEDTLELFGPAREHFKTLYFQWELVNLSRAMLYTAVPALLVAGGMVLYYDPAAVTGTFAGIPTPVLLVSTAATVTLVPFVLLVSYILRIATVAKRTLSIGPFILGGETPDRNDNHRP